MKHALVQTPRDSWREARRLAIICACVCGSPQVARSQPVEEGSTEIVLGVGAARDLATPKLAQVYVADGSIVRAADLGPRVRLFGKKTGVTEIRVGKTIYILRVLSLELAAAYQRVRLALKSIKGLVAGADARGIVVRGRLLRAEDWDLLAQAAGGSVAFRFVAEIDPSAEAEALERVRKRLADFNLPEPALRLAPMALASLSTEQSELLPRFEAALRPYGFTVEKNQSVLGLEPMIRVNILVAEMKRSFATRIGAQWPGSAQAQLLPNWVAPGGSESPISIDLNALEQLGLGKVLASPHILCRSGKEAEFFAGGEFPIKIANFHIHDVIWKKYGVLLKIKPRADAGGRMSIGLQTEVSNIDRSVAVEGIPGIVANRIESHFDLAKVRTIALSGLIKKEWGDSTEGLPFLSRIPILGRLFSSEDWLERKTELVVFVTPEVLPADKE